MVVVPRYYAAKKKSSHFSQGGGGKKSGPLYTANTEVESEGGQSANMNSAGLGQISRKI